ncbi:hypothetical protein [Terriglobus saanensis]|uniref:Uncharacterized protein n=1 Tax=Terriglobus saanensis (strain ATCC BAA-1853 / DSM 23119 / SP1PR4) TaxID=401053 RepID=E8V6P4_TERSS|nr:hypothetical protein [Terriglobus saanensis]ADV83846.1 hypothetical protein AciPR4_3087 [Terriglobus saanensis SP1PR4]
MLKREKALERQPIGRLPHVPRLNPLKKALSFISAFFCNCEHRDASHPYLGMQFCWACGRVRKYRHGVFFNGFWHREAR